MPMPPTKASRASFRFSPVLVIDCLLTQSIRLGGVHEWATRSRPRFSAKRWSSAAGPRTSTATYCSQSPSIGDPGGQMSPSRGVASSSCWLGAFGSDSRHRGASPATCSIKMIIIALLPEDAALRIHFGDIVALVASHQDIPVGQPAGARWVRQLDLEQRLAAQVHGLDRLVVGNHEDLARWRHVNAADAAAHLEREGLDLLALGIQPDTDALGRETEDFALGDFEGGIHVPATILKVVAKDLLAFAIQFQDLRLGGDER